SHARLVRQQYRRADREPRAHQGEQTRFAIGMARLLACRSRWTACGGLQSRAASSRVRLYAPLTGSALSRLVRRLRLAIPQWHSELGDALRRTRQRLAHTRIEGVDSSRRSLATSQRRRAIESSSASSTRRSIACERSWCSNPEGSWQTASESSRSLSSPRRVEA